MVDRQPGVVYDVYRSQTSGSGYAFLARVTDSTDYVDDETTIGITYYYVVRAANPKSSLFSPDSVEVQVTASSRGTNRYLALNNILPPRDAGQKTPYDHCDIKVGDADGDGLTEFLVAFTDSFDELDRRDWNIYPANRVKVMLFDHDGALLWGPLDTHVSWAGEFPWTLQDMNGDERDEIVGLMYVGPISENALRLVMLDDGGGVLRQSGDAIPHDYPPDDPVFVNRLYLTIACLDGARPFVVIGSGVYGHENVHVLAYDQDCQRVWDININPEPAFGKGNYSGGSHMIRAGDIDRDGRDEVVYGSTALKGTSSPPSILWQLGLEHTDFIDIKDVRPDIPGLELLIGCEQANAAVGLFGQDGTNIWWSQGGGHAHYGWAAKMMGDAAGLECYTVFKNFSDFTPNPWQVCSSQGQVLQAGVVEDFKYSQPVDWDGDDVMEKHDQVVAGQLRPAVPWEWTYVFVADIIGDYREEILIFEGGHVITDSSLNYLGYPLTGKLWVYTNTEDNHRQKPTPWEGRLYSESKKHTGYRTY